jgi:hypothetical protein
MIILIVEFCLQYMNIRPSEEVSEVQKNTFKSCFMPEHVVEERTLRGTRACHCR